MMKQMPGMMKKVKEECSKGFLFNKFLAIT